MDVNNTVCRLLETSYSPFHAVKNIEEKLLEAGFVCLDEKQNTFLRKADLTM